MLPLVLLALAAPDAAPLTLHVAPAGNDANSGRADAPFASPAKAVAAARALRNPGQPVRVVLAGGRYELAEPLVFTPSDSHTEVVAADGAAVALSGGRRVGGWKAGDGGEWVAPLPYADGWAFRHAAANGKWVGRSRHPETGWYTITGLAGADPKAKYNTPADRFEFAPGQIDANWKNLTDVEAVVLHFWVDTHLPVAGVDADKNVVRFDRSSRRRFTEDGGRTQLGRFYLTNVPGPLKPGQFYHDRAAGVVRYRPRPGEALDRFEFVAPRLTTLVELRGDPKAGAYVDGVALRGLTLADTHWQPAAKDAADAQASANVPGAVVATAARDCRIDGCTLTNLGGYAVDLRDGCRRVKVAGNTLTAIGAGGVKVTGGGANSPDAARTVACEVTDNRLSQLGRTWHSGVGVLVQHAAETVVAYNDIGDLYYTGVSVGWVWGYGPSVNRDNRVEFNHIHHCGQGLLSDMGGVYLLGVQPGTVVRNNRIHDIEGFKYGGWGTYTDEGSTGVTIESNVVYRTTHGGFHQHYGRENVVRNNVFAFARDFQIERTRAEPHKSFTFERNVVTYREGALFGKNWKDDKFDLDRNVYWRDGRAVETPAGPFEKWQARGFDRHSVVADPRFKDANADDFTLLPDSPALKLGFVPIDVSKVGPRR